MINLIRIDDRLIHGQVMAVWVRVLGITHIIVCDEDAARDAFTRKVMRLAVPVPLRLSIVDIEQAVALLDMATLDTSRTLVLLRTVESAFRLHSRWPYKELNVGGIGMAPGRNLIWQSIAASSDEMVTLRTLGLVGVDIYLQMIPSDEKRSLPDN